MSLLSCLKIAAKRGLISGRWCAGTFVNRRSQLQASTLCDADLKLLHERCLDRFARVELPRQSATGNRELTSHGIRSRAAKAIMGSSGRYSVKTGDGIGL